MTLRYSENLYCRIQIHCLFTLFFHSLINGFMLQMGQIIQRDVPQVSGEVCDIEEAGVVVRLCPLEGVLTNTPEDTDLFVNCLIQQLVSKK